MVRLRQAALIRHQFFVLFAPLGGTSFYQIMVAAGSASEQVTVALAALASGIAMSALPPRNGEATEWGHASA